MVGLVGISGGVRRLQVVILGRQDEVRFRDGQGGWWRGADGAVCRCRFVAGRVKWCRDIRRSVVIRGVQVVSIGRSAFDLEAAWRSLIKC